MFILKETNLIKHFFPCLAILLLSMGTAHAADNYPSKPVTLVTPFAPGGGSDLVTRVLADALSKNLPESVVVQNVGGAGGVVGTQHVARAKPDGYTLLLHHIGMATAPALFKDLQFDPQKSFEPIGLFADTPMVIVGSNNFAPNTMEELVAYVKQHKHEVNFASSGAGSATHLCAIMFQALAGAEVTMIQYRGAAPALVDVQSGRVDLLCDVTAGIVPHIKSGSVKAYVLTGKQRLPSLPDLPTATELGIDGLNVSAWYGFYAPAGTPKPIIDRLSVALQAATRDASTRERLTKMETLLFDPSAATPEALREKLATEVESWTSAIRKAGIEAQ